MWVCDCFIGDSNEDLKWAQHDFYFNRGAVTYMFTAAKSGLLTARDKSKLEFSLFHRSEQVQQIDHRVLQDTHDRIAAFYRLTKTKEKHVSTPLEADAKTYREYLTESWKQYYFAEIDSLSKIVEFSTSVVSAVLYANQPEGYQAEDRIVAILDKRYGNEYWELLQL